MANVHWIIEKAREFQKNICFIDYMKAFDCGSQQTGKFFKKWEYQITLPTPWETCMQVKNQQNQIMEQRTGSKLGKGYVKAVYCHRLFNLYAEYIMRNARLDETQVGIKIAFLLQAKLLLRLISWISS